MSDSLVDLSAESAVLGCCMLEGRIPEAAHGLRADDFGHVPHALTFAAMLQVHAGGAKVDALTVAERLKATGQLVQVGGPAWLMDLDSRVPFTENLRAYVATVRELAFRRALEAKALEVAKAARNRAVRPVQLAQEASTTLGAYASRGWDERDEMGDVDVMELNNRWDAYARGEYSPFLGTGLEAVDEVFRGFLCNVNLVGAKASMGKTALAAEVIWRWLCRGIPGGIFGLEDGTGWLIKRHLARALNLDLGNVAACRLNDWQEQRYGEFMAHAHEMLGRLLRVHRTSGLDAPDLLAKARRWIARGAKWLWIDHGGRIGHASKNERESENLKIKATVEALDNLAHNTSTPIIVNWHFNREGGKREGRPTMEDFRESGYLEAFAGTMLGLWERDANPGMLLVTVVKNREGPRDVTCAITRDARFGLVNGTGYTLDLKAEAASRAEERTFARRGNRDRLFTSGATP